MSKVPSTRAKAIVLAGLLSGGVVFTSRLVAQSAQVNNSVLPAPGSPRVISTEQRKVSPYRPVTIPPHAVNYYRTAWGVDSFSVRSVESGEMIRFSYHVVNVEKAKALNDKRAIPFLVDAKARVKLVVPTMEKVGQLRQSSVPEEGKVYWMVFSNKGHIVKPGNRVSVIIGKFHAEGLVVEGS